MKNVFFIFPFFLLLSFYGVAQKTADSALKQTTIEVIQAYKPEITHLERPALQPELPPADTSRPSFSYTVPQQTLYYTYHSLPLRPLMLSRDTTQTSFPGYVKLGGGDLSTIYLEAGSAHFKGRNYQSAFYLSHLGQEGDIKYQKTALSTLRANADYTLANHIWNGSIDVIRNQYFNYGYNHARYDFARDDVRNTYFGVTAQLATQNIREVANGIFYKPAISAGIYSDGKDNTERSFNASLGASKSIDSTLSIGLALDAKLAFYHNSGGDIGNNLILIKPFAAYSSAKLNAYLGLNPAFGRGGNTYLLPDLYLSYKTSGYSFLVSAGWKGTLQQNTFKELTTLNPYLNKQYDTRQTRKDEIYGSLATSIGDHLSFGVRLSYWNFNNLPLFLNDTGDAKSFYIVYDDQVNALSFQPHIQYQIGKTLTVTASGTFYNFTKHQNERVWHMPTAEVKGNVAFSPIRQLTIHAYVVAMDGIYARNANGDEERLPTLFDAGCGAEYRFVPRISIFGNVINILNSRNQRWMGYNAYGFNVFGGLRLSF